jgi:hypothetical protein
VKRFPGIEGAEEFGVGVGVGVGVEVGVEVGFGVGVEAGIVVEEAMDDCG